jgi:hypothetical protein
MNVVLMIFNRPDLTRRVAEAVARARPSMLLVVADGPRATHPNDSALTELTRKVIDEIEWPCEVIRNYSEVNLGCRKRIVTGLNWVFTIVEEAIILEDDTLPDPSFFPYCVELLERYRQTEKIAYIGGYQFFPGLACVPDSYYFSIYGSLWGWATWRRAWQLNDDAMTDWPRLKRAGWTKRAFPSSDVAGFFEATWDTMRAGFDTWDYRWYFAIRRRDMFCVVPHMSLVENIGFGLNATHTTKSPPDYQSRKACQMAFPLRHPVKIDANVVADKVLADAVYSQTSIKQNCAIQYLKRLFAYVVAVLRRRFFARYMENCK